MQTNNAVSNQTTSKKRKFDWDLNEPSKESLEIQNDQTTINTLTRTIERKRRQPPEWDIINKHLALNEDGSCKIHRPGCKDWKELSEQEKKKSSNQWSDLKLTNGKIGKYKNQGAHNWYISLSPEKKRKFVEQKVRTHQNYIQREGIKEWRNFKNRQSYQSLSLEKKKEYSKRVLEARKKRKAMEIQKKVE